MYDSTCGDVFRYNPVFYSSDIKVCGDSYVDSLSGNGNAIGFQLHTKKENLEGAYYEYKQNLTEAPYILNGSLIINANVENAAANEIFIFLIIYFIQQSGTPEENSVCVPDLYLGLNCFILLVHTPYWFFSQ
jgi:hypothetical protein